MAEPSVHAEALACLDGAYVLCDITAEQTIYADALHTRLGVASPITSDAALLAPWRADARTRLEQMLTALRQGQVTAPQLLALEDGTRAFAARASIAPTASEVRVGVVWFTEASAEYRQVQRLSQESEKLKGEIKHYSTLLNIAPFPIWQRDGDLNIRFYNLAYGEVAEADDHDDSAVPELHRRERALAAAAMQSGEAKSERLHVVAGGERKWMEVREIPIPQDRTVVGFAQDVSEIEVLQEDMQRYLSAQSNLLESSASAMAIFGKDMRLQSFNYAYVALWKLDETWLDTHPSYGEILELLREKRRLPEQANFAQFKQQQVKLFTDLPATREEFYYLPDGKALRVIVIPHALGGLLFAYEDVTDRLSLERSYNTLIAVQRETLDNLSEGVAVFGEDGRLKLSNPVFHRMWHLEESYVRAEPHVTELVDRVKHLYHYADGADADWQAFRADRIAQVQSRTRVATRLERTDGKVIDCVTVPLPDGATLVSYVDVTDSTLVERSLREADRLKSEFLANVSYELRSPLTSISGFAEMLRQEYFGPLTDKQKEYIDGITQSSQHLMQLVSDILDLASIEAGYMHMERAPVAVAALLSSVLPLVQERSREHGIHITVECPPNIGQVEGDETRLRHVLFKLLANAIKFSPPGGAVVMGAATHDDTGEVEVWVRDHGYGIPAEEQERVFNTFYKGARPEGMPKTAGRSGTGLGLAIVKHFVELHGGRVLLESSLGQGTSVRCFIPRGEHGK